MINERRFRHKTGFMDHTDYIAVRWGEIVLVLKDGSEMPTSMNMARILANVAAGLWIEVTEPAPPCGIDPDGYAVVIPQQDAPRGFWWVGTYHYREMADNVVAKVGNGARVEPVWKSGAADEAFRVRAYLSRGRCDGTGNHSTGCLIWGDDGQGKTREGWTNLTCSCGALADYWQRKASSVPESGRTESAPPTMSEDHRILLAAHESLKAVHAGANARIEELERKLAVSEEQATLRGLGVLASSSSADTDPLLPGLLEAERILRMIGYDEEDFAMQRLLAHIAPRRVTVEQLVKASAVPESGPINAAGQDTAVRPMKPTEEGVAGTATRSAIPAHAAPTPTPRTDDAITQEIECRAPYAEEAYKDRLRQGYRKVVAVALEEASRSASAEPDAVVFRLPDGSQKALLQRHLPNHTKLYASSDPEGHRQAIADAEHDRLATIDLASARVTLRDDRETRDKVFEAVLEFYKKHGTFAGESVMQMDSPQQDAAPTLAEIVDLFEFKVEWK